MTDRRFLLDQLDTIANTLGFVGTGVEPMRSALGREQRRSLRRLQVRNLGTLRLREVELEEGGTILLWEDRDSHFPARAVTGRRRRAGVAAGSVIKEIPFERLPPNQVGAFLERMDWTLTPERGLRRLASEGGTLTLQKPVTPVAKGRILLLVHGTFSGSDTTIRGLAQVAGRQFLQKALAHYDQVLTFDHPTVSVSPAMNALDLARLFASSRASIDVICHSRGGLVTRWWLEAFGASPAKRRVVFVGSPLAGTNLASPARLRGSMNFLTNVATALGSVAAGAALVAPILTVVEGVLRVVASITGTIGNTPLFDAAIAMIPGLAAQSRSGNNQEILRLRAAPAVAADGYYFVQSNFRPDDPGWKFWRYFVDVGTRLTHLGAQTVFEGDNDLVVDTVSMTSLQDEFKAPASRVLDFGTNATVYHTNYFSQPATVDFIAKALEIP